MSLTDYYGKRAEPTIDGLRSDRPQEFAAEHLNIAAEFRRMAAGQEGGARINSLDLARSHIEDARAYNQTRPLNIVEQKIASAVENSYEMPGAKTLSGEDIAKMIASLPAVENAFSDPRDAAAPLAKAMANNPSAETVAANDVMKQVMADPEYGKPPTTEEVKISALNAYVDVREEKDPIAGIDPQTAKDNLTKFWNDLFNEPDPHFRESLIESNFRADPFQGFQEEHKGELLFGRQQELWEHGMKDKHVENEQVAERQEQKVQVIDQSNMERIWGGDTANGQPPQTHKDPLERQADKGADLDR